MLGATLLGLGAAAAGAYLLLPGHVLRATLRLQRRAAGLATKSMEIDGHRVVYLDGGRGEPLLLLHGFGANKDHFTRMARWLTPHFRVIAPDLPGNGDSSRRQDARYAVDDQLRRIHELVERLGLPQFALGGNSMGGYLAALYAARHPERVSRLWLLAPAGVAGAEQSELQRQLAGGENPLIVRSAADFDRLAAMCFHVPPYVPAAFKRPLAARAIEEGPFNAKMFEELFDGAPGLEEALSGLVTPTLVVWGDRDRLLHVSGAGILQSVLPNATAVVMPAMGHCPPLERPRETAEGFLRFVRA